MVNEKTRERATIPGDHRDAQAGVCRPDRGGHCGKRFRSRLGSSAESEADRREHGMERGAEREGGGAQTEEQPRRFLARGQETFRHVPEAEDLDETATTPTKWPKRSRSRGTSSR